MNFIDRTSHFHNLYNQYYTPNTDWPTLSDYFIKLPDYYNFNLSEVLIDLAELKNNFNFYPLVVDPVSHKKLRSYKGIGLTHRKNANDVLSDAFNMFDHDGKFITSSQYINKNSHIENISDEIFLKERHFTEKNLLFKNSFQNITEKFKSPFSKVRLLELMPGGRVAPHIDLPYYDQIRVHAVLETNPDVWWEVDGHFFQIPADGSFYWFDTGKGHAVYNNGKTSRIVLSVHLSVYFDLLNNPRLLSTKNLIELINLKEI